MAVRLPEIFQQLSAFKRRRGIGEYYQQRHTQEKCKDDDSVAFRTAYNIVEGTPPQNSGEIAVTTLLAKKLDADIGDTVIVSYPTGETAEFIITALYQAMVNQGISVRVYTDCDINYIVASGRTFF